MEGILYILHGRRNGRLSKEVLRLAEELPRLSHLPSEVGFLEGEKETLEDSARKLAERVDRLIIVPLLLFPATHAQIDLPERLAKLETAYEILPTLGTTEAVYQQLLAEVRQAEEKPAPVLLIAHGTTHFSEPQQQLLKIAERLSNDLKTSVLTGNHIGKPDFKAVLADHPEPLIIVPLFLSSSFLYRKILNQIQELRGERDQLLPALSVETNLNAVKERLEAAGCIR